MAAMANVNLLFMSLILSILTVHASSNVAAGTEDGSEQWGYVEVRPKVHLFWWQYKSPHRIEHPSNPWPTLLWLQGGPDSPVGTGFSYTEDENLAAKNDVEAAADLTTLLKELFNGNGSLQNTTSPLYIFAESFAVTLGVSALRAIEKGELKLQLGGVALGDSWISPEDFVNFYNFMLDASEEAIATSKKSKGEGAVRRWGGQGNIVFPAMASDFMNPRIAEIDELLAKGINVTIYNGQVDLILCNQRNRSLG